jgi:hypothetical protein
MRRRPAGVLAGWPAGQSQEKTLRDQDFERPTNSPKEALIYPLFRYPSSRYPFVPVSLCPGIPLSVIPTKVGIYAFQEGWIPTFVGMTR